MRPPVAKQRAPESDFKMRAVRTSLASGLRGFWVSVRGSHLESVALGKEDRVHLR